jgi:single-strand DNA-binding protein
MVNQATLLGRIGRIDTKHLPSGISVTNLTMVTSKKYNKDGVAHEKTTWHNVTLFAKLSEIAEKYVKVGDLLYIQGEMDTQKYTGTDQVERTKSFIIAHELKLMPKAGGSGQSKTYSKPAAAPAPVADGYDFDQEIPF